MSERLERENRTTTGQKGSKLIKLIEYQIYSERAIEKQQGSKIRMSSRPRRPKNEWGQPKIEIWLCSLLPDIFGKII